jgi:NADPH-dependent ferric siderophore reductase
MVVRGEPAISHVTHPVRPRWAEVVAVTDVTPRMRRITLSAAHLADLPGAGPTDHLKVFFPVADEDEPVEPEIGPRGLIQPPPGIPRPYREYTIRRHDPDRGEVDLDVVRHGHGLAAAWAERARPGLALWLLGPRSSAVVSRRDWYLVGGDETALPAIGRWLADLPDGAAVTALVEVADAAEEQPLPSSAAVDLRWLHRDGAEPGTTTLLADALARWEPPPGEGFCWMGAEAAALRRAARRVRRPRRLLAPGRRGDRTGLSAGPTRRTVRGPPAGSAA